MDNPYTFPPDSPMGLCQTCGRDAHIWVWVSEGTRSEDGRDPPAGTPCMCGKTVWREKLCAANLPKEFKIGDPWKYSLKKAIEFLEYFADQENCDGRCDELPPHRPCPECLSRRTLNRLSEDAQITLLEIAGWLKP